MSAQVIAALRRRADVLVAQYKTGVERAARSGSIAPGGGEMLWLASEFRALADEAEGFPSAIQIEGNVIKDPEAGDFVRLSGKILSIHEGTALVEVYRSDPVGLRVPVQCGALEHVEPVAGGDMAPAPGLE